MAKATERLAINLTGKDAAMALKVKATQESKLGTTLSAVQIGRMAFVALAQSLGITK